MSADLGPDELDAFVDGELALTRHVEIEARVAADGALRARVDALRRLRESVRDHADYHAAPASLRAAITGSSVPTTPSKSAVDSRVGDAVRRWLAWRPLASALALVVLAAVGVNLVLSSRWHDERLRDEVVASHTRATLTQHLVDVASSDHHVVKPYLSSRLDFSPPVRALTVAGSVFLGGRVDYLDGRPVAALVYRQGNHLVEAFVWPTKDADSAVGFSSERGFRLARWSREGMAHCLISDVSTDTFAAIAQELARAPASAGAD